MLQTTAPELFRKLVSTPPDHANTVVARACNSVGTSIPELEPEIVALLERDLAAIPLSVDEGDRLRRYVSWSDERYFDLRQREVDESVWIAWFDKARLASAIAQAFSPGSASSLADAVYELSVTSSGKAALRLISSLL
jgi:hypothetical protein